MSACCCGCCCRQDGEEDQGGTADGRMELYDSLLQEQLLRWLPTGAAQQHDDVWKNTSFHLNCACHIHDDFCLALQDSIDLFLGNFALDETNGPTPLRVQKDWKFLTVSISRSLTVGLLYRFLIPFCVFLQLPIIMLVAFSMCIVCLLMAGKILDTRDDETGRIFQQRCRKLTEINVTLFNLFILLKLRLYY